MNQETLDRVKTLVSELSWLLEVDTSPVKGRSDEKPSTDGADAVAAKPIPPEANTRELRGIIGRPVFSIVKGRPCWTAGLGVRKGDTLDWHNLVAWNETAEACRDFGRGIKVRVWGEPKESTYVSNKDGQVKTKHELVVSAIDFVQNG